jgi:hypothetical protein
VQQPTTAVAPSSIFHYRLHPCSSSRASPPSHASRFRRGQDNLQQATVRAPSPSLPLTAAARQLLATAILPPRAPRSPAATTSGSVDRSRFPCAPPRPLVTTVAHCHRSHSRCRSRLPWPDHNEPPRAKLRAP